jgi:hypothetical protein
LPAIGAPQAPRRWSAFFARPSVPITPTPPQPTDGLVNVPSQGKDINLWVDPLQVRDFVAANENRKAFVDATNKKSLNHRFFSLAQALTTTDSGGFNQSGAKVHFRSEGNKHVPYARLKIAGTQARLLCDIEEINGKRVIKPRELGLTKKAR